MIYEKQNFDAVFSHVIIDSRGVQIDEEQMKLLDISVLRFLDKQKERFAQWKQQKRQGLSNIGEGLVIDFAKCVD